MPGHVARPLDRPLTSAPSAGSSVQLSPNLCRETNSHCHCHCHCHRLPPIHGSIFPYPILSCPILSHPIQVYRLACGPSRSFSPPLYGGVFNAAIDATTSAGASRCQVASVRFELAPTVTAKTWPLGRSVFKRAWNISRDLY